VAPALREADDDVLDAAVALGGSVIPGACVLVGWRAVRAVVGARRNEEERERSEERGERSRSAGEEIHLPTPTGTRPALYIAPPREAHGW